MSTEKIEKAIDLHRSGKINRAKKLYEQILKSNPDSVDALHFLGVLYFQNGQTAKGVELVTQALKLNPRYADAHNNLGNMLKTSGRLKEAELSYALALQCNENHVEALSNLGVIYRLKNKPEEALTLLSRAAELAPNTAFVQHSLALALATLKRFAEADDALRRAFELDDSLTYVFLSLGRTLSINGYRGQTIEMYRHLLEAHPGHPIATHMLAATLGEDIPDRAADDYVQSLFDKFAASFEMQLERLNYKAPELIRNELDTLLPPNSKLDVLDLGCGTGWCGREIKHLCKKLVGVDLSPGMLKKARQEQTYKELFEEEMVQHLTRRDRSYDLMVSSDAIIYLGKLDELCSAAWQRLNASGHLVFTLEKSASEEADFVLEEHGRYSHSQRYISGVLTNSGFNLLKVKQVVVRMEIGEEVQGWMVVAQKPATA